MVETKMRDAKTLNMARESCKPQQAITHVLIRPVIILALLVALASSAWGEKAADPARGFDLLLDKAYLPPAFDQ